MNNKLGFVTPVNVTELISYLYEDPEHDTVVFFYSSELDTHALRLSETRASFYDTVAMRFDQHEIDTVDFLAYDVYTNGIPIEHLDLDWEIPSIYLFPA